MKRRSFHPGAVSCAFNYTIVIFFLLVEKGGAQNLESIGNARPVVVTGGVNASSVFYSAGGMSGRRDPFNYFLSGNLAVSLYGWSVPFSFSYSNQASQFHQPFNQYGLSPTYKSLTMHAGYRSMTFSNYTVNGHPFLGGGFDIALADRVKVSAFYGRLQKAVEEDTANANVVPAYKRLGGGVKVLIGDEVNNVGVIFFKARDEISSLIASPVKNDVCPEENLTMGLNVSMSPHKKVSLTAEYASSAITKNMRDEVVSARNIYDKIDFAFQPRTSSSYQNAIKAAFTYSLVNAGVGLAYERVDPGYRTLGSYYFNNDIETFAVTLTSALLKKVKVNGQAGVQRNNLDHQQMNAIRRFSTALNVNCQFSQRLVVTGSYSSFQTVVNFRSPLDDANEMDVYRNMDTLNFRQVAQNANINANFTLSKGKEHQQNINLNLSFQQTSDVRARMDLPSGVDFYNVSLNYTVTPARDLSLGVAGNGNFTKSSIVRTNMFGPSISARKIFFEKKFSTSVTASANAIDTAKQRTSMANNIRASASYGVKSVHQFDVSFTWSNRMAVQNDVEQRFRERIIQLGYSYDFSSNQTQ